MLRIERKGANSWVATKFVEDHNHSMVSPSKVHYLRPRRHFAGATKNAAERLWMPLLMFTLPQRVIMSLMNPIVEGGKKIAVVKKNVAKVTPPSSHASGNIQEDNMKKSPLPLGEMAPSLWPWQEALPHRFNLNDGGVPVADLNQPSMAPVSIHPDGAHPDNTVVLTCFKSMAWIIENKNSTSAGKVVVINLKEDPGEGQNGNGSVLVKDTSENSEERIVRVELHKEATEAYMAYTTSVQLGRALPDVRYGLKPVHRRIL
ncbi:hypothetical protein ACE6H2_006573 [Prunus campanulata]